MRMRQATAIPFVFLTSSSCTASVPRVECHLVEVRVTSQGTPRDRWCIESHAYKDLYSKMFMTTLFIIAKNDRA